MYQNQEFNRRLGGIRERFVLSLGEVDADLRRHMRRADEPQHCLAALSAISAQAHRLRGLAPILGLDALGNLALEIEETILGFDGYMPAAPDVDYVIDKVVELRGEMANLIG